jgi:hypothetical protein
MADSNFPKSIEGKMNLRAAENGEKTKPSQSPKKNILFYIL